MPVKAIPDQYATITPYLIVDGAAEAIDFYQRAFGAKELYRIPMGERIGHAELQMRGFIFMLADEFPSMGHLGPKSRGGTTVSLLVYVEDVDQSVQRAVEAGAKLTRPVENQFYGDRNGMLEDPFGHQWTLATHVEDVSEEELQRRMSELMHTQA